jgi:hypothetical protein
MKIQNDADLASGETYKVCVSCNRAFFVWGMEDTCIPCRERLHDKARGLLCGVWIIGAVILTGMVMATSCHGASPELLDHVAWCESRNNPHAVGKRGELGAYQLKPIAIREVNRIYHTHYHMVDADNMVKAREIASRYLDICARRTKNPTPERVYRTYRGIKP